MRASSKCHRVESSSGVTPPPPSSSGDPPADEYVDLTAVVAPPPSTSDDSSIRRMLDTVMTVQAAYGQLVIPHILLFEVIIKFLLNLINGP